MIYSGYASGLWQNERGANLVDGGAPFYDTYECADGKYVAVGAMEPQFFEQLVTALGLTGVPAQHDRAGWPAMRRMFETAFRSRTRDDWAELFADVDGCVTPVLDLSEAPAGAHLAARGTFTEAFGVIQPEPAPRMSRTPGRIQSGPTEPGADSVDVLRTWGFDTADIDRLIADGVVRQPESSHIRERT
jgi:alpha-methylacyl-CoA racemase